MFRQTGFSGLLVFQASQSLPAATSSVCRLLGNALCFCSPIRPAQAVPERDPQSLAIELAVKTFDYLLEYLRDLLPDDQQGLELGLKLELCRLTCEV